jgi:hypothetical protein
VSNDIEERKKLSFEQAEGVAPLPSQLQLREVSQQLRALLWNGIHSYLKDAWEHSDWGEAYLDKPWSTILRDEHVHRQLGMVDDFKNEAKRLVAETRNIFEKGDYVAIFGWLEFVLKHPACPSQVADHVDRVLRHCGAAYRVVDRKVICPIAQLANSTARVLISAMPHLT